MTNILYPKDYKGEPADPKTTDRTPTPAQKVAAKVYLDTIVSSPTPYDKLIPLIEKQMPHVFTTEEMVSLFDEMNVGRKPEVKPIDIGPLLEDIPPLLGDEGGEVVPPIREELGEEGEGEKKDVVPLVGKGEEIIP